MVALYKIQHNETKMFFQSSPDWSGENMHRNGTVFHLKPSKKQFKSWLAQGIPMRNSPLQDLNADHWTLIEYVSSGQVVEWKDNAIANFINDYAFLSNSYKAGVFYEGVYYPTVEHAFQASKTDKETFRDRIRLAKSAGAAKKKGNRLQPSEKWESEKHDIMYNLLIDKFTRYKELRKKLLNTKDTELRAGRIGAGLYWGVVGSRGENHLGILLMKVREVLRDIYG